MTDFNHTPGPWGHYECDIHYGGVRVAWAFNPEDARLIALAPRMLDAIAEFVRKVEAGEARSKKSYAEMRAILDTLHSDGETCDDN